MSAHSRGRRARRRLGALALGLLLAPLAAEGLYRGLRSSGLSPTTNPAYVEHDALLGWRYRPGTRERHVSAEFDVAVEIHSAGFRGPEWEPVPTGERTGRPRVLVLGDSFAFGWGVEHAESLPARLAAARPDWQVLGAGVSGYGTDQQCLLLETLEPRLRPDCVVVVFCENDLHECATDRVYGKAKPRFTRAASGELRLENVPVPYPWIERVSHVWRALAKRRSDHELEATARDPNAEWALVCDLYRRMARVLDGRPLVVVSTSRRLARLAAEEPSIEHLDLAEAFGADAPRLHFPLDGHWNAAGHARAAAALAAALPPLLGR
ncbi:MAG: hypothetical protein JNK02_17070 [Planctomycetes bacterium]|nr:hypothetical protein [Planctomycetota bacterium]